MFETLREQYPSSNRGKITRISVKEQTRKHGKPTFGWTELGHLAGGFFCNYLWFRRGNNTNRDFWANHVPLRTNHVILPTIGGRLLFTLRCFYDRKFPGQLVCPDITIVQKFDFFLEH